MKGNVAETFEELRIYQLARQLTNSVYQACRGEEFRGDHSLVDQIRRVAVSVMSNIAEGFERGTKLEFLQFLFIAKGSCGEVRAQLQIATDQGYISSGQHIQLSDLCRKLSSMISSFIAHLQKSRYEGEKFSRPARRSDQAAQKRRDTLRAAQLVNMHYQENS